MTFLLGLMGNIWFRRALVVAACLAALWWYGARERSAGRKEGAKQATDDISSMNEKNWEQMRRDFQDQQAQTQAQIAALNSQVEAYRETSRLLASQRQQATQQVAGMTESQVDAKFNEFLGRLKGDSSPLNTEQKRKVDDCFTQKPILEQQVQAKTGENEKLQATLGLKDQQYALLGAYTTSVENAYTTEFNANKHKKRSPKCLWIWRCGVQNISAELMPPLLKSRPAGGQ